jgi:ketosteroid isomerase-like protein
MPYGGVYRGRAGVGEFFAKLPHYYEDLSVEPDRYFEDGDTVVVLGRFHGKTALGEFELPFAMEWTVRDGRPVAFTEYADTAAALRYLPQAVTA